MGESHHEDSSFANAPMTKLVLKLGSSLTCPLEGSSWKYVGLMKPRFSSDLSNAYIFKTLSAAVARERAAAKMHSEAEAAKARAMQLASERHASAEQHAIENAHSGDMLIIDHIVEDIMGAGRSLPPERRRLESQGWRVVCVYH